MKRTSELRARLRGVKFMRMQKIAGGTSFKYVGMQVCICRGWGASGAVDWMVHECFT